MPANESKAMLAAVLKGFDRLVLEAILLMEHGLMNPELVISHQFPLTEIHKAVEAMASPKRNKVLIIP